VVWNSTGTEVGFLVASPTDPGAITVAEADGTGGYGIGGALWGQAAAPSSLILLPPTDRSLLLTAQDPTTHALRLEIEDITPGSPPSHPRLIPDDPSAASAEQKDPALSPDGTRIAYVQVAAGVESVWVMGLDRSRATRILDAEVADGGLAWTPDGAGLYLLTTAGGNRLQAVEATAGATPLPLATLPGPGVQLAVRPRGTPITGARLAGADRIGTAVAISQAGFADRPSSGAPSCDSGRRWLSSWPGPTCSPTAWSPVRWPPPPARHCC
jgi:hypothetical protein